MIYRIHFHTFLPRPDLILFTGATKTTTKRKREDFGTEQGILKDLESDLKARESERALKRAEIESQKKVVEGLQKWVQTWVDIEQKLFLDWNSNPSDELKAKMFSKAEEKASEMKPMLAEALSTLQIMYKELTEFIVI